MTPGDRHTALPRRAVSSFLIFDSNWNVDTARARLQGRGREAGRGLLTLANLITAVAPVAADWNDSHIFNQRWPSHARFHGVVALAMTSSLAGLNLWSLWSPSTDRRTSRLFAAAVPVGYWAPFLVAPLVRGTGVDDPPHPIPRVGGVPTSLLGAAATTLTAVAGWLLDRRAVTQQLDEESK
jgi:hypothetical protein